MKQQTAFERKDLSALLENLPSELQSSKQWVVWKLQKREGNLTKVPYNALTRGAASSTDSATWATLQEALTAYSTGRYNGIGFVFADGFCGVDLDKCRNPITGEIEPWALAIVEKLDSYSEISPSLTGLHILSKAKLEGKGINRAVNGHKIEIYDTRRFFTITGDWLEGTPSTINKRQIEVQGLYEFVLEMTGGVKPEKEVKRSKPQAVTTLSLDDSRILEMACKFNGEKFQRLLNGDVSDYAGDDSRADMAFVGILAFYTLDDEQLIRLWQQSGLYRAKLERNDYVYRTLERARGSQSTFYGLDASLKGSQDATLKGEPEIDLSDCEEITDDDPPISSNPKRNEYLLQLARNKNLLRDTFAIYLRLLGFEKSHDRFLSALTSVGGTKTCKFSATNEQLQKKYSGVGKAASPATVKRDKKKLLEEIQMLDVAIIGHRSFPDAYNPETQSCPPSEYQNHLLRKSLEAINIYLDENPKDKFIGRQKLETVCLRLLRDFPKPEPAASRKRAKGKGRKSEIEKAKAKISRALDEFLEQAQKSGLRPQDAENWLVSTLRSRKNEPWHNSRYVAHNEPHIAGQNPTISQAINQPNLEGF
jgi:putative DNA primase/helicase